MTKMKKFMSTMLCLAMAASMTACGGNKAASTENAAPAETAAAETTAAPEIVEGDVPEITSTEQVNIIWSHNSPETSSGHQTALKFKERLETLSGGKMTVTIYPNGQMGSVPENDQAIKEGTIQIMSGTAGGTTDAKLEYFDAPCLVTSDEEAFELFGRGTELREYTEQVYESIGLKMLSFVPAGFREMSSNKEVRTYADLKGLNVRIMETPVPMEFWKDWGANPTPLAFSELYTALQQGLVDAQENTYDTISASKLYEQQKYIVNTNHTMMWAGVYMNLAFYNSLPADYQALLDYVWAEELDDYSYEASKAANDAALKIMTDAGLEVIDFTDEEYAQMRQDAKPAYEMIAKDAGDDVMNKIYAALGMN